VRKVVNEKRKREVNEKNKNKAKRAKVIPVYIPF